MCFFLLPEKKKFSRAFPESFVNYVTSEGKLNHKRCAHVPKSSLSTPHTKTLGKRDYIRGGEKQ